MGEVIRSGRGGGFGQVSPSHVGSGGWTARAEIVGSRGKPYAVQNLIPFSLQRCGFLVQRPGLLFVFAPSLWLHFVSVCLSAVLCVYATVCLFAPCLCVFAPTTTSMYLRRALGAVLPSSICSRCWLY